MAIIERSDFLKRVVELQGEGLNEGAISYILNMGVDEFRRKVAEDNRQFQIKLREEVRKMKEAGKSLKEIAIAIGADAKPVCVSVKES